MDMKIAKIASNVFTGYKKTTRIPAPLCPICKEPYLGDGKEPCVDCELEERARIASNNMAQK